MLVRGYRRLFELGIALRIAVIDDMWLIRSPKTTESRDDPQSCANHILEIRTLNEGHREDGARTCR